MKYFLAIALILITAYNADAVHYKFTHDDAGNETSVVIHDINGKMIHPNGGYPMPEEVESI
jgi:hypothetical protein